MTLSRPILLVIWVFVAASAIFFIFERLTVPRENVRDLDYKTFINLLESNKVQTFDAIGLDARGALTDGEKYQTQLPNRDTVLAQEIVKHVRGKVVFESASQNSLLYTFLTFVPFFVVIILVTVILRAAQRRPPPS